MNIDVDVKKTLGIPIISLNNDFEKKFFMNSLPEIPEREPFWYVYNRLAEHNYPMRGITSYYFYKAIAEKYLYDDTKLNINWIDDFKDQAFDDIRSQLHRNFAVGASNIYKYGFLKAAFNLLKNDNELLKSLIKSCDNLVLSVYEYIFFLYFACDNDIDRDKLTSNLLNDRKFNEKWDLNEAILYFQKVIFEE